MEIKRRGEIDGVEQLTRYLELLNRDPSSAVRRIFAAQEIKPQARVLATDRGITCAVVDYDALRGMDDPERPPVLTAAPLGSSVGARARRTLVRTTGGAASGGADQGGHLVGAAGERDPGAAVPVAVHDPGVPIALLLQAHPGRAGRRPTATQHPRLRQLGH